MRYQVYDEPSGFCMWFWLSPSGEVVPVRIRCPWERWDGEVPQDVGERLNRLAREQAKRILLQKETDARHMADRSNPDSWEKD